MANERIDIEVTDKVDSGVAKKLNQIADAADRGQNYLERLKVALSNVNSTAVDRLAAAMAKADSAQAKLLNAQARLTNAQNQGAVAASKEALAQQKLATEAARTGAAQARAAAASAAAERAQIALVAAQQRAQGASAASANAQQQLATATASAGTAATTSGHSFRQYVTSLNATAAASNGAAASGAKVAAGMNSSAAAANQYARAARTTTHANANIIAQLQDIGVSLAGGQNPLLVAIQQGSQLSYIASTLDGGMKALLATILRMLAPFTLLATAIGGLYLGFKNFTNDIASKHKPELEQYARSLGLTDKEMKKLGNSTVDASGKLKEFDTITITMGDSWNGFIATVKEGLVSLAEPYSVLTGYFTSAWDSTMSFLYNAFLGFYAAVHTLIELLAKTFVNVFKIAANVIIGVFNGTVLGLKFVANTAIDFLNDIGRGANAVLEALGFDGLIPTIDKFETKVKSVTDNMYELESINIADSFNENVRTADRTLTAFGKRWEDNAAEAARKRIKGAADAIIGNRTDPTGKVDKTAERRAHAIDMVNLKLDDELKRMKLLKDERAVQQRMDQIEEQLAQKKIKLNDAERVAIEGKVRAIEAYKYVQAELDRIYEEAVGPQRTYNATIQATSELLAQQAITAQQASQQTVLATRALAQANDPLFDLKESLTQAEQASTLYGQAIERNNAYEQIRLAWLEKGIILGQNSTAAIDAEVAALMRRNDALQQQLFIQSQISTIINPLLENQMIVENKASMYAEIDRLRQEHILNEENAQRALYALDAKYSEMRLAGASSFFGELASLSSSGNQRLAAIGKAAAVAQATIDGYVAVQKALASAPPPWNYAMAAAVAFKTGAQVAGIMSTNVGSFATGGQFMVNGRSGVDANNINMNVTRGERVTVETPAQQRANDNNSAPTVDARTTVQNFFDEESFIAAMDSDAGERVVKNIIRRNPGILNGG